MSFINARNVRRVDLSVGDRPCGMVKVGKGGGRGREEAVGTGGLVVLF